MICNSCGSKNQELDKFCRNCGNELRTMLYCTECGTSYSTMNRFCTSCGYKLDKKEFTLPYNERRQKNQRHKEKSNKHLKPATKKINGLKVFWITFAVVVSAFIFPAIITSLFSPSPRGEVPVETISSPFIEAQVYEIASKFVCSCGSCNEESLEICRCGRAIEERQFIRTNLEQNQNYNDVITALSNKYGWMKAEFAATYNIDPSNVWNPKNDFDISLIAADPITKTTETPWNSICPVKGKAVHPSVATVKYNGKIYGFCCAGCDEKFKTNPDFLIKNLSADGKQFIGAING